LNNINTLAIQRKKSHGLRVIKDKGIDQYLDAARQYKSEKDIEFHICGKCDPEYSSIIEELHREGVIIYHGAIESLDEIVKVYQMSSCIIHPTYYPEGISNVLLEAAASGRPIIATNRSGCREVVDEGINGFLIKQKDSSDLISAVKRFLSLTISEREKMGLMGRRKIESGFNREIIVDNYLDQISKALNK
jgi:galacturonosyltransferase